MKEKRVTPLEKGQNLHRAFFLIGRVLYFFLKDGCVGPEVMVLKPIQWIPGQARNDLPKKLSAVLKPNGLASVYYHGNTNS